MADAILQMAEQECADRGGDVDHEDQHDGLLGGEVHRLLRVDRGERDHRLYARLIEHRADQEAPQVAVIPGVLDGLSQPRERFLHQVQP